MAYFKGFIAGFISTLTFHQGLLAIFHWTGAVPFAPYNMSPTWPFHVPAVISLAFWGGVWGMILWGFLRSAKSSSSYWWMALLIGAIGPTAVAFFVVVPLKGGSIASVLHLKEIVGGLLLNGTWGLGVGVFMRLFQPRRAKAAA